MSELKIENNKVICSCGRELGEFKEGKIFYCKNCHVSGFSPLTYGVKVSVEDIFGKKLERSDCNSKRT